MEASDRGEGSTWLFLPFTSGVVELRSIDAVLDFADVHADPLGESWAA